MSDAPKTDTALDRVRFVLPMLKLRIDMVKLENPDAEVMFGVLCVNKDGTGRVVVQIPETKEFLTDLAEVAGVKDNMGWFPKEELEKEKP